MVVSGTTMGLRIPSRYLCAFKLASIGYICVHCSELMPGHNMTPPPALSQRANSSLTQHREGYLPSAWYSENLDRSVKRITHSSKAPDAEGEHLTSQAVYDNCLQSGQDPDVRAEHAVELFLVAQTNFCNCLRLDSLRWYCWVWRSWADMVSVVSCYSGRMCSQILQIETGDGLSWWNERSVHRRQLRWNIPTWACQPHAPIKHLQHLWHCVLCYNCTFYSPRHTCALTMMFSQHLDMSHLNIELKTEEKLALYVHRSFTLSWSPEQKQKCRVCTFRFPFNQIRWNHPSQSLGLCRLRFSIFLSTSLKRETLASPCPHVSFHFLPPPPIAVWWLQDRSDWWQGLKVMPESWL